MPDEQPRTFADVPVFPGRPGPELFPIEESVQPVPILSVNVDFNDLLTDRGEAEAFEIVGKLKDLLA